MRKRMMVLTALLLGGAGFWILTKPVTPPAERFTRLTADPERGAEIFTAAGCASCHMATGAKEAEKLVLSGGQRFETGFGTFIAPNISSDPTHGIGGWTVSQFANAVTAGVSPEGEHYYPAFPWTSYVRMEPQDVVDLHGYMASLPASAKPNAAHELPLPLRFRRGIGLWKRAFFGDDWHLPAEGLSMVELRGRYLVEALGHCGECHTPRAVTGQMQSAAWLGGGPDASGKGRVPNITPGKLDWSEGEIAGYLATGFTPDYDSVGGHMALVVENFAALPQADRDAVAAYLKRVPAVE